MLCYFWKEKQAQCKLVEEAFKLQHSKIGLLNFTTAEDIKLFLERRFFFFLSRKVKTFSNAKS